MAGQPSLPFELEREIFETVALLHPSAIPTLLRVARRVLIWVEPFLYRVVCASSPPGGLSAKILKSPAFFDNAVHHLLLDGARSTWSQEEARHFLSLCKGILNFGAIGHHSNPTLLPILAEIKVQRVALCLQVLFGEYQLIDLGHRAFHSITHLDIFDRIEHGETIICAQIPTLPCLTHLCLNYDIPWDKIQKLLTDCPRIELLVVLWSLQSASHGREWANNAPIHDMRFASTTFDDYWDDWEKGARGLPNFWSVADIFVAQKRARVIDRNLYWIEDDFVQSCQIPT
ncbi:Tyrosinase central domain-containing protein [Mycena venus]|uniref:Tyrosinase central domain-containing protein n=1 Tax=Mycena venus TaxID=2733690 RepID=A0A8H7CKG5_9AGAR|nr:Tyrosinase central domain-containing protein [Mycena venus]